MIKILFPIVKFSTIYETIFMKYKVIIDGQEQEMDLVPVTELLKNDELFKEAMEMRGVKTSKSAPKQDTAEFESLKQEISALKEIVNRVSTEKSNAEKELKTYLETQKSREISTLVEKAIAEGKITPEKKEEWVSDLTNNFELASKYLSQLPGTPSSPSTPAQKQKTTTGASDIPFRTSDTGVLEAIQKHQAQGVN